MVGACEGLAYIEELVLSEPTPPPSPPLSCSTFGVSTLRWLYLLSFLLVPTMCLYREFSVSTKNAAFPSLSKDQWIGLLGVWPKFEETGTYTSLKKVAGQYQVAGKQFPTTGFIEIGESPIINNPKSTSGGVI